jgi:predicted DNA-binding protein (MmcQ/YjbR family)
MSLEWIRAQCMSLPHSTEQIQWGDNLVFKIGGKIYAIARMIPDGRVVSFKCTPQEFAELTDRPGIIPAPYLARAHWVALESLDALPRAEIKRLLAKAYELVLAKLPKRDQAAFLKLAPKRPGKR